METEKSDLVGELGGLERYFRGMRTRRQYLKDVVVWEREGDGCCGADGKVLHVSNSDFAPLATPHRSPRLLR